MKSNYNVIIIGGGPAGYSAAFRASKLGASTVIIEKDNIGGTCLNRGCIPTKFLWENMRKGNKEFYEIQQKKSKTIELLIKGLEKRIKDNSIQILKGIAGFSDNTHVSVTFPDGTEELIEGEKIIIATGSFPSQLNFIPVDHKKILDSDDILNLDKIPESLLIIGGGAIGVEFATIFNGFGSNITLVEKENQLLPGEDVDVASELKKIMERQGIKVMTGINSALELLPDYEIVLIATGRKPNVTKLNLEIAGITYTNKGIHVNEFLETSAPNIYAAGDVTGGSYLAYVSEAEGIIAAENAIANQGKNSLSNKAIPRVVFSNPPIASAGQRERDLPSDTLSVTRSSFSSNQMAFIEEQRTGWVKIISAKDSKIIIGGAIIGVQSNELITILTLAIEHKLKVTDLKRELFFHPALSEAIYYATN